MAPRVILTASLFSLSSFSPLFSLSSLSLAVEAGWAAEGATIAEVSRGGARGCRRARQLWLVRQRLTTMVHSALPAYSIYHHSSHRPPRSAVSVSEAIRASMRWTSKIGQSMYVVLPWPLWLLLASWRSPICWLECLNLLRLTTRM